MAIRRMHTNAECTFQISQVQASLNEKLPQLEADAAELKAAQAEAREANTAW